MTPTQKEKDFFAREEREERFRQQTGERTAARNKVIVVIYRKGATEIYWAHNGALTKRYNTPKLVIGFLNSSFGGRGSQFHPEVHKTIWVTEIYADKAEAQVRRELLKAQIELS